MHLTRRLLLIAIFVICASVAAAEPTAAESYLLRLDQSLDNTRQQMPAIVASGRRFVENGRFYTTGPQQDFIQEATGRAGGLMCAAPLKDKSELAGSIVLYARGGPLDGSDTQAIERLKVAGAMVVAFAAAPRPSAGAPDALIDSGPVAGFEFRDRGAEMMCPIDTVANVVNMWTWTGEMVAACTRLGKMPVLYESYGMPGGHDRARKYAGKGFHDDLKIAPIDPQVLGPAYLDAIHSSLQMVHDRALPKILEAARDWRATDDKRLAGWTMGHMFPIHFQDRRAPQRLTWSDWPATRPADAAAGRFVLMFGYQSPPDRLIKEASAGAQKLVYISVKPAAVSASNIIHIDSCWPLPDGCVKVSGYDVPILPPSGVVDAAIYWSMLAQACSADQN